MRRSAITMQSGGDSLAPALGARERDGHKRRRASESASARGDAGVSLSAARRRGRASFTLPTWFNIAATVAVAAAIAIGVLLQG